MKHLLLILLLISSLNSFATDVFGIISTNTTYTAANSPYTVTSSLTVNAGVTLTIESGAVLNFNDNLTLTVNGTLVANGVTFTSANASPTAGKWNGVVVNGDNTHTFTNCQVLYAKTGISINRSVIDLSGSSFTTSQNYGVYATHSVANVRNAITANNITVSGAGTYGVYTNRANLTLSNSTMSAVGSYGIYIDDTDQTGDTAKGLNTISSTTISDGSTAGIGIGNADVSLTNITINNSGYPVSYVGSANVTYAGSNSFTNNDYDVILFSNVNIDRDITLANPGKVFYLNGTKTVNNGAELTIESGVIIKMPPNTSLDVKGKITADAAPLETITFTSWYDDNTVGDSNGDGSNTSPSNGQWYGIIFREEADDTSLLDGLTLSWTRAYGAITTYDASPTVTNSSISNAYYGAMFNGVSSPTFTNNTIGSSEITPIAMSFEANPIFSNNSFSTSDNTYDAIGLLGGEMTANGTIVKRNFTDIPNVTYVLLTTINVPENLTLTIEAGVVIKALSGQEITVNGTLNATGELGSYVVFTSVNDDNYGNPNDTRNDGNDNIPAIGNFGGILFGSTSVNSVLDSVLVKFGNNTRDFDPIAGGTQSYGSAVAINSSDVSILDSKITDANYGLVLRNTSSSISRSEFVNTEFAPIRMSISSTPTFSDIVFSSVGWRGIAILDEYVTYSGSLAKRDIAGFTNVTYILNGLRIEDGAEITIDAGLNIKVDQYDNITVYGGLKVAGTTNEPVIFTSLADDNVGGSTDPTENDTQGNGNATDPNTYKWGGIIFEASSDDTFSSIANAEFWYGGYNEGQINYNNSAASLSNVDIKFASSYGLYFENNSTPTIDNVLIQSAAQDPIALSFFANPTFTNMTFDANASNGLKLIETILSSDATIRKRDIAGINNIAYILGNLDINSGATLTINPGVVLKLPSSQINVYEGAIQAIGTVNEPIIFTSRNDDSRGGDTNNDGNGTIPIVGNWGGIDTYASSLQSHFNYCEFRYGGSAVQTSFPKYESSDRAAHIRSTDNSMILENSLIQLNSSNAIGVIGTSTASITNNRIENICSSCSPVNMSMFASPTFDSNSVENIGYFGLRVFNETFSQNATIPFRSFAGIDSITYIIGKLDVASGTEITIPAGMVFKGGQIDVDGKLIVAGEVDNPVVFTVITDDEHGRPKDTQSDGIPTYIGEYANHYLVFRNISDDNSLVDHAYFRYNNSTFPAYNVGAILLESSSPTIQNSIFEFCDEGITSTGLSEPIITNNRFIDLYRVPISTSIVSWPMSMSGNTLEGSTWKGIKIRTETLTQDTTLVRRAFAGNDNIPYIFGHFVVGTGVKLSINPGLVLKFAYDPYSSVASLSTLGYINVKGALYAVGGPNSDSTIIFTDLRDDFYGGRIFDDNRPTLRDWQGITFENESSDSESILKNVIIRKSGGSGVILNSASPTIENVLFIDNKQYGLNMNGASNPSITACDFLDNGTSTAYGAMNNIGSFQVSAANCWWGDNSGPYHATLNIDGKGQRIVGDVTFDPWATDNSLNPITGDVSLNGTVSAYDAALTLQNVAAIITFEARQDRAGDVSGDGSISAMDASYILQFAAGQIRSFPAEAENKRTTERFASTYSEAVLSIGSAEISTEFEEVSIPLSLSNIKALHALSMKLPLGEDLEFLDFEFDESLSFSPTLHLNEEANELNLAFGLIDGLQEDFDLGTLRLKVNKEKVNFSSVELVPSKLFGNETDVLALAKTGKVFFSGAVLSTAGLGTQMNIYPNPAVDRIMLALPEFAGEQVEVRIIDTTGKKVFSVKEKLKADRIEVSDLQLKPGIYVIRILGESGEYMQQLIIGQ